MAASSSIAFEGGQIVIHAPHHKQSSDLDNFEV